MEYSKLVTTTPINWGEVAQKATGSVVDVIKKREEERKALDKEAADGLSKINQYTATKNPSANNFLMTAAQNSRSYIQAQNDLLKRGMITPEEYKQRLQNIQDSFKNLNTYATNWAQNQQAALERQSNGQASGLEQWATSKRNEMFNFRNQLPNIGERGNLVIEDTRNGSLHDSQFLNAPGNIEIPKLKLVETVDGMVKNLGVGAIMNPNTGRYTISETMRGNWEDTKKKLSEGVLSSPRAAAGVLVDNAMGYEYTDKKEEAGGNKIYVTQDENGLWTPQLTDEQNKKAEEIVSQTIESRVDFKETDQSKLDIEREKLDIAKERNKIARQRNAIAARKSAGEEVEEDSSTLNRYQRIMDVVSKGPKSEYSSLLVGQVLPFMARRKNEKGELEYEGYTTSGFSLDNKGNVVVQVKRGYGDNAEYRKINYQPEIFISDVNALLNKTQGTKIKEEQLMDIYKGGKSSTTSSSVKPAP
jgi:hypothetical protein